MTTGTRLRSPATAASTHRPQPREVAKGCNSSMYYYSDTLRKGHRVGSDSGISVDTPPPRTQQPQPRGLTSTGGRVVQTEAVLNEAGLRMSSSHRNKKRRLHEKNNTLSHTTHV